MFDLDWKIVFEIAAGIILATVIMRVVTWFWIDVVVLYLWHGDRDQREANKNKD